MAGNNKNNRLLCKLTFCKSAIFINLKYAQSQMKAKSNDYLVSTTKAMKLIYYAWKLMQSVIDKFLWWYTMYHDSKRNCNALLCFTFLFIEIKWHFQLKLTFISSPYNFYDLARLDIESFKFLGVWFETQLKLV